MPRKWRYNQKSNRRRIEVDLPAAAQPVQPALLIAYYALPSQPAQDKFPALSWRGTAYQVKRWINANRARGFRGLGSCNALAARFFWHYPCEFLLDLGGI